MKRVAAAIFALIIAFVGVLFLTTAKTDTSGDPESLAKISRRDLENDTVYYAKELIILDVFATMDDDVLYISVMFEDRNGDYAVLNMPVNPDDEIWEDVHDYIDDDSQTYGDLVLDCYVQTETNVNVENKLYGFFDEWVSKFEDQTGLSVATNTELRFDYLCDEDGDPYAIINGAAMVSKVVGVLTIAAGILVLCFGALRKPKKKSAAYTAPSYSAPQQPQNPLSGAAQAGQYASAEQLYLKAKPYKFMGKTPDFEKAFDLHLRAANMGYAPAQYEVGYAYALGFGVTKDEQKAFQWYLCAAQQGDMTSQRNVAHRYISGEGTHPDPQQARYWYQRAVDGNDGYAMLSLGKMYEDGVGGEQNLRKALELYHRAAEKGTKDAKAAYEQLAVRLK